MFFAGTKALGIERIRYDTIRECTALSSCETVGALATKPSNWGIVKWCGCQLKGLGNLALTQSIFQPPRQGNSLLPCLGLWNYLILVKVRGSLGPEAFRGEKADMPVQCDRYYFCHHYLYAFSPRIAVGVPVMFGNLFSSAVYM